MKTLNLAMEMTRSFERLFQGLIEKSAQIPAAAHLDLSSPVADRPASGSDSLSLQLWRSLVSWATQTPELSVWQEAGPDGETLWHAYDPISERSFTTDTEADMRRWVETRYYME